MGPDVILGIYAFKIHFDFYSLTALHRRELLDLVLMGAELKGPIVPGTHTQSSSALRHLTFSPQKHSNA